MYMYDKEYFKSLITAKFNVTQVPQCVHRCHNYYDHEMCNVVTPKQIE